MKDFFSKISDQIVKWYDVVSGWFLDQQLWVRVLISVASIYVAVSLIAYLLELLIENRKFNWKKYLTKTLREKELMYLKEQKYRVTDTNPFETYDRIVIKRNHMNKLSKRLNVFLLKHPEIYCLLTPKSWEKINTVLKRAFDRKWPPKYIKKALDVIIDEDIALYTKRVQRKKQHLEEKNDSTLFDFDFTEEHNG